MKRRGKLKYVYVTKQAIDRAEQEVMELATMPLPNYNPSIDVWIHFWAAERMKSFLSEWTERRSECQKDRDALRRWLRQEPHYVQRLIRELRRRFGVVESTDAATPQASI